ncbi:hypothetical protein [Pseudomonas fluorescens]|jgi:hypothetical protein|uniref:hypothetical protein n=1 Tax=Pseudomonas fluorescens TaxID=294 RepID=UPI0020C3BB96|nr:hypothetical protein [Pseudomonas fluorescens]UTL92438.1 hypothetical protein NLL86_06805 [Pseudomonas fluorescens]
MSHPEINTEHPDPQARLDIFNLNRLHRGSLGAYSIARVLRENHGLDDQPLEARDQYGLLLALEFICYDLYAHHEAELELGEGSAQ